MLKATPIAAFCAGCARLTGADRSCGAHCKNRHLDQVKIAQVSLKLTGCHSNYINRVPVPVINHGTRRAISCMIEDIGLGPEHGSVKLNYVFVHVEIYDCIRTECRAEKESI